MFFKKQKKTSRKTVGNNPHTQLVNAIIEHSKHLKFMFVWKNNTGAMLIEKRLIKFGEPGQADIIGVYNFGKAIAFEIKTGSGKLTAHQKNWRDEWERRGGEYHVIRSIDDFLKWAEIAQGKKQQPSF